ncbi:MAG: TatD family hydrolase, partial [Crenarchaeota archaeon]|nr:TatD family hydrolase [Thermoproteota archaeon]MDW8034740.1 TatD family hydrolase [Nitrososphaerota archaeon]
KENGLVAIVDSGLGKEGALKSLSISERFRGYVYSTIGMDYGAPFSENIEELKSLILDNRDKIIGIGEVGLDYYTVRKQDERVKLIDHFIEFVELSKKIGLPLIVHSRSAGREAMEILLERSARKVLMHAFDGKASHAMRGVESGFFFSIPPSVIRSPQKQKLVSRIPIENILLESDSPVLGTNPLERNEPANIVFSLREIARIKNLDLELVAEETTKNARRLFGLEI